MLNISEILTKHRKEIIKNDFEYDLNNEEVYKQHSALICKIAQNYLNRENRKLIIDDNNKNVFRFLTYYFNGCRMCETIFENENYSLNKNILLIGAPGTGKTFIMQVFSDYLNLTKNHLYFKNISVTQMLNTQRLDGNINKYTYNEKASGNFEGNPYHFCLHDIGIERKVKQQSFGTDLQNVIDDFLFARYEIYQQQGIRYHLTSNLSVEEFEKYYQDRLLDRFKYFNVLVLDGESKRI